ncbi:MFS transporter [Herminiimonas sp. CN]|uniref:MFS transporter n=1 Tax=Herminiimonas sp. CN TaxID=1349818 RepID=UPI000474160E|nr:MFS transporter [Herminiimonas sp. CN]
MSALAPLRGPAFRMLWLSWFAANLTVSMGDVASAWLMTSLSNNAMMVALVQSAATLPVFILGLPSGALADISDRRRFMAATLAWGAAVATALYVLVASGALTASLLLGFTFASGIGVAMRWPVFIAIIPEIVSNAELPSAIGLNAIAVHMSRLLGPVLAGVFLASMGSQYVFLANALLSIIALLLVMQCRPNSKDSTLPGERFVGAMRVGLKHVMESPRMRVVLARTYLFFFQVTALTALLPLVARNYHGAGIGSFTVMLAAMGGGAIAGILVLPYLRRVLGQDRLIYCGTGIYGIASVIVVVAPTLWLALLPMVVVGMAWIGVANSLTIAAQMTLPKWVRARGMSFVQIAMMGGIASGAALWGYVANLATVSISVFAAAIIGPFLFYVLHRLGGSGLADEDLTPVKLGSNLVPPVVDLQSDEGPVIITIEYMVDPTRADEFRSVMKETRRARLRQGAVSWKLYFDISEPGRYIEQIVNESWVDHHRLLERFTAADASLRERRLAFHTLSAPPRIQRYLEC